MVEKLKQQYQVNGQAHQRSGGRNRHLHTKIPNNALKCLPEFAMSISLERSLICLSIAEAFGLLRVCAVFVCGSQLYEHMLVHILISLNTSKIGLCAGHVGLSFVSVSALQREKAGPPLWARRAVDG